MKNIVENNKMFAEFLGYCQPHPDYPTTTYWYKKDYQPLTILLFHSNWDWLMRVVEKIESLGYTVTIAGVMCKVTKVLDLENSIVSYVLGDKSRKLELIYTTMVEFVKWHNKN